MSDEREVYISGEYYPERQAKISVFDSAIMLGDAVTDSTRTFDHRPFKLAEHVARLYKSLKVARVDLSMDQEEMTAVTQQVVARNLPHYPDTDIWIVHNISRGAYPPTGDPSALRTPTVIIHTAPMDLRYWARFYVDGCHAVTPSTRMIPHQALDPRIKNRSRMAYTLAEMEAKLVDPLGQSLILDIHGNLGENKGGNFFVVADGKLFTPGGGSALHGISRQTVIELAGDLGIPVTECDLQPYDVYTADEAFFTSTPYSIMPATKFNGVPVGDGRVGPITQRLLQAWSELVGVDIVDQALSQLSAEERAQLDSLSSFHEPSLKARPDSPE